MAAYHRKKRKDIPPGRGVDSRIKGCWIPRSLLKPEQLSLSTLDPLNLDGFRHDGFLKPEESRGVLVFERSCQELQDRMASKADFLRDNHVLFLPAKGKVTARIGYSHFKHELKEGVERMVLGPELELRVGG
jgi:hypothetical protein